MSVLQSAGRTAVPRLPPQDGGQGPGRLCRSSHPASGVGLALVLLGCVWWSTLKGRVMRPGAYRTALSEPPRQQEW